MAREPQTDAEPGSELRRMCRDLFDGSPLPTISVEGPSHVVVYCNAAYDRLVGEPTAGAMGRPFGEVVPEAAETGCLEMLDRVFRTGLPASLPDREHRHTAPVWRSYTAWATPAERERPAGVLVQVTDTTESARFRSQSTAMNEALLVSAVRQHELVEAAEALGARLQAAVRGRDLFLASLSHELRNPLAPLVAGVQILKQAGADPAAAQHVRSMMERQLKQLTRLVDDLLDVSRITTGKLQLRKEPVELAPLIGDAVEACRTLLDRHGHVLTVDLPREPIGLNADPTRITQIFSNLLTNAARYIEGAGHIRLSAEREGDEIVVRVRDDGIGMPPDRLQQVFEVFVQIDPTWQRTQGGLGIGLSLVREFVVLHGGRIEARSDGPGTGSEFVVRLPTLSRVPPPAPVVETPVAGRRILVVDDNPDVLESLAALLELLGHEVHAADGGAAGVAAAAVFRPELILMDLGMPGVDGLEAARRIRREPWGNEPFLVALTGWGGDDDRRRTQAAGFDRHLVKPADPDVLLKTIAEVADRAPNR